MRNFFKNRTGTLVALIILGAAARLAFAFYVGGQLKQPDEGIYIAQAEHIYQYGLPSYADMRTDRPPGTGSVILLAFLLSGVSLIKARILFALLSSASIFIIYKYAEDISGRETALLAAAIAALYPFFIYWSGILTTETISVFFITAALFFTGRFAAAQDKTVLYGALGGLCWGLLIMTRAQNLYFLPFLMGLLLWEKTHKTKPMALLLFFVLAAALPSLWMSKNYNDCGSFTIDTHGGLTLLINTAFYDESRIDWGVGNKALENSEIFKETLKMTGAQKDRYYREKAVEYIKAQPARFLWTRLKNFAQFWRFYPRTDLKIVHGSPFLNQKHSYFTVISLLTEPWLILLGLYALLRAAKARETRILLPLLFVLFTTALHTLVFSQMRYRLVLMPILIVFAVFGFEKHKLEKRASD